MSPGKCRNDNSSLIHNCFHPTVIMFTFRTRFRFSVSLNNGKIELACPQVVWDGRRYVQSQYVLYLKLQSSAMLLPDDREVSVALAAYTFRPASRRREEKETRRTIDNKNVWLCVKRSRVMFIVLKVTDIRQWVALKRWKQVWRDGWEHRTHHFNITRTVYHVLHYPFVCPVVNNTVLFYYINPNKMHMLQSLFYLTTALHVSGVTITHLQEHKQL